MSTSKVVRSGKEVPNALACLSAYHALLLILALPPLAHAWQSTAPPAAGHRSFGNSRRGTDRRVFQRETRQSLAGLLRKELRGR